jgi:hypothetical protein
MVTLKHYTVSGGANKMSAQLTTVVQRVGNIPFSVYRRVNLLVTAYLLGINLTTRAWCYLDLNGNLTPIPTALNDASNHLTKNGVNISLGANALQQNPDICAAINRHVYTQSNWNNVADL